ncbi:DUF72 domain-containing protein [Thiohalorhabdus methylotrophus]|uniref:DUF72 domain-containing protein n=1 Tax=Thiohalorhabdus methylotrophus TaxID=3242694 RepID=A0ABV4TUV5_9GAMM
MDIRVGTCGFAEAQARTFRDLEMLEDQKTFYQPPRVATARRWRERAGPAFTFAVKAWQLITHYPNSPTYRRLRESLDERQRREAGGLRWNPTTRMAWERTQAIADALVAEAVLLQTPASFRPTAGNLENLHAFLRNAERRGRYLVFEPRGGEWTDALVAELARETGVVHGVDPFLRAPATGGYRYFRLHGHPAYGYHYRYTDEELDTLAGWARDESPVRILFNNDAMAEDGRRFQRRLKLTGRG